MAGGLKEEGGEDECPESRCESCVGCCAEGETGEGLGDIVEVEIGERGEVRGEEGEAGRWGGDEGDAADGEEGVRPCDLNEDASEESEGLARERRREGVGRGGGKVSNTSHREEEVDRGDDDLERRVLLGGPLAQLRRSSSRHLGPLHLPLDPRQLFHLPVLLLHARQCILGESYPRVGCQVLRTAVPAQSSVLERPYTIERDSTETQDATHSMAFMLL